MQCHNEDVTLKTNAGGLELDFHIYDDSFNKTSCSAGMNGVYSYLGYVGLCILSYILHIAYYLLLTA